MACELAQDNVIGIDNMPVSFNPLFGGENGTHEHTTPIDSKNLFSIAG
jgi:hypothetical protein